MLQARPWLIPWGTESWPARTPWVSPVGGNRSHSEGEPVLVLSRKGKEDCPELLTVLAVILKETWSTLAWFLAPALGSAVIPRAKFARGSMVPQNGSLHCEGHQRVWCAPRRKGPPFPSTGLGSLGLNAPDDQLWKKRESKLSKNKSTEKEEKKCRRTIYSKLECRQDWNKIILNKFIHLTSFAPHFNSQGNRVRVRNPNPRQFPWDPLPWQPIVYLPYDWLRAQLIVDPLFRG